MAGLSKECATRLAKILPRLASEFDGEVVATVRAIVRTLTSDGASLHDLAAAVQVGAAPRSTDRVAPKAGQTARPEAKTDLCSYVAVVHFGAMLLDSGKLTMSDEAFVRRLMLAAAHERERFIMKDLERVRWLILTTRFVL